MKTLLINYHRRWIFSIFLVSLLALYEWWVYSPFDTYSRWIESNRQSVGAPKKDHFSFAVFGDNKNSKFVFEKLLKSINTDQSISFCVALGDMVQGGRKREYARFIRQVNEYLQVPLLVAPGNHEMKNQGRRYYRDLFGAQYYSFSAGNSYCIVLKSITRNGLGRRQLEWLRSELKGARCYTHVFIFMHIPPFDPRKGSYDHCLSQKASDELYNVLIPYRVSCIFAGHLHGFFQGEWKGIPYVITGSAGAELAGDDPEHYFFHYTKVTVRGNEVRAEAKKVAVPICTVLGRSGYIIWIYTFSFLRLYGGELLFLILAFRLIGFGAWHR